ncbi:MAG: class I SAM-dependent methyltransferase [Lautropia sp.]
MNTMTGNTVQASLSDRWDHHARTYQQIAAPCTGYLAQSLFQSVAGRLPTDALILDIACGGGELARAAALHTLADGREAGGRGHVVATDFSPQMVERTRRLLEATCPEAHVDCIVRDGQALGFDTASFDAAFSAFGIFLFPDRKTGWREAARVLRPGGWFATAVWRGPEHNALAREQVAPILSALPASIREAIPQPGWLEISTAEGLAAEVAAAGFTDVEVSVFDAVFTAPTSRAMWEMALQNPPMQPLFAALGKERLATVEQSVVSTFERRAGGVDRPLRLDCSCHFLVARRA